MSDKEVRERIANIRKERELSYQDLADLTGINKSTLQRYETGKIKDMPLSKLEAIAKALSVDPSYLLGWDELEAEDNQPYDQDALDIAQALSEAGYGEINILFKKISEATPEDKKKMIEMLKIMLPKEDEED